MTLAIACLMHGIACAGEFCYESKCWQYEDVSDVRIGGMQLKDGEYARGDHATRSSDGVESRTQRAIELVVSGNFVDVGVLAFTESTPPSKTIFSFQYDLSKNQIVEGTTNIEEGNEVKKQRIARSLPQIADDLLKNHGIYSTGETVEYPQTVSIRGDELDTHHVLTLLGKIRHQGEDFILIRSDYTFELKPVSGSASGYIMQDIVTNMPRHTAHSITMKVGDKVVTMNSRGYAGILAR